MINSIKNTIILLAENTSQLIFTYTTAEISIGKILLALMGLGISGLLIVVAIMLVLIRKLTGAEPQKPKAQKQQPAKKAKPVKPARASGGGIFSFLKRKKSPAKPSPKSSGFVFLKKKASLKFLNPLSRWQ